VRADFETGQRDSCQRVGHAEQVNFSILFGQRDWAANKIAPGTLGGVERFLCVDASSSGIGKRLSNGLRMFFWLVPYVIQSLIENEEEEETPSSRPFIAFCRIKRAR